MFPQLEADAYDPEQIQPRIRLEWNNLSDEHRALWDDRYHEQMREYEREMDEYKRDSRRITNVVNGVVGATSLNESFGGGTVPGSSGRGIGLTNPSTALVGAAPGSANAGGPSATAMPGPEIM